MAFGHRPCLTMGGFAAGALDRGGDRQDAQNANKDDGGGLEGFRDKAVDPFTGGEGLGGERSHYAIPSVAPPDGSGNSVLHCDIASRGLQFNKR